MRNPTHVRQVGLGIEEAAATVRLPEGPRQVPRRNWWVDLGTVGGRGDL